MRHLYEFLERRSQFRDPPPTWHRAERIIREEYDLVEDHGRTHDALTRDGTPVEIKSCVAEYVDGRPGQFEIWDSQMDELLSDGRIALLVYARDARAPVLATRLVEPTRVLHMARLGWKKHHSTGWRRLWRVPWPRVIELDQVAFWWRGGYAKFYDEFDVKTTRLPGFPNLDPEE